MSTQFNGSGSFAANSAISAFRAVAISSNRGVGLNPNNATPIGFTQQDVASGDYVAVKFFSGPGTQKCAVTVTPVTVGDSPFRWRKRLRFHHWNRDRGPLTHYDLNRRRHH